MDRWPTELLFALMAGLFGSEQLAFSATHRRSRSVFNDPYFLRNFVYPTHRSLEAKHAIEPVKATTYITHEKPHHVLTARSSGCWQGIGWHAIVVAKPATASITPLFEVRTITATSPLLDVQTTITFTPFQYIWSPLAECLLRYILREFRLGYAQNVRDSVLTYTVFLVDLCYRSDPAPSVEQLVQCVHADMRTNRLL